MENSNTVPRDIGRRSLITNLLNIPPILLGLGTLESIVPQSETKMPTPLRVPTLLQRTAVDITRYKNMASTIWLLYYTGSALGSLPQVRGALEELKQLVSRSSGALYLQTLELLYSNYKLAARITCDQRDFVNALAYANDAVNASKDLEKEVRSDKDAQRRATAMIGAALYTRGFVRLEQGGILKDKAGVIQTDYRQIEAAQSDFEEALTYAVRSQLKGLILRNLSCTQSILSRGGTDVVVTLGTINQVRNMVGIEPVDDPYEQILLDGLLGGLTDGWYLLGKAIAYNNMGRPAKALEELDRLEELETGGIASDQTRNQAWTNVVRSQAALGTKDYVTATSTATRALVVCRDIQSVANIANIKDIYMQLQNSSYKTSKSVEHLGKLLRAR